MVVQTKVISCGWGWFQIYRKEHCPQSYTELRDWSGSDKVHPAHYEY